MPVSKLRVIKVIYFVICELFPELKLDFLATIFSSNIWNNCVGFVFINDKVLQWGKSNSLCICCLFCHLHLYILHIYKSFLLDCSLVWLSCSVSVLPGLSQSEKGDAFHVCRMRNHVQFTVCCHLCSVFYHITEETLLFFYLFSLEPCAKVIISDVLECNGMILTCIGLSCG